MQGYRTYVGLLVSFIGFLGFTEYFGGTEQLTHFVDVGLQFVGLCVALYGNIKAHAQIDKLGGYSK